MWNKCIGTFVSSIGKTDEESTGKWLVPILFDDDQTWEKIKENIEIIKNTREFSAYDIKFKKISGAMISSFELNNILGHHLVCVFTYPHNIWDTLNILRDIGITGELKYKSDKATMEDRDEYLHIAAPSKYPRNDPGEKPAWENAPAWAKSIGICEANCYDYFGKWCYINGYHPKTDRSFSSVEYRPKESQND